MSRRRPIFAIAIILIAKFSLCISIENDVSTTSSTSKNPSTDKFVTEITPETNLPNLCETCSCTDAASKGLISVNCTQRSLEYHFQDAQWPPKPMAEVIFVGNVFIHLKPFPNVTIGRLILRNNRITKIDDKTFKEIRNLTELDLSHNQLTSELFKPKIFEGRYDPTEYEPLAQLRVLNLAMNALHTLQQDIFEHVADLRVLILSGNPLTTIDQGTTNAISGLLYLEELDLSYCDLFALADHMFHAPSRLKKLYLNGNRFTTPPIALEDCKSLEYLNMDENPFVVLDRNNAFPSMKALTELSLCCLPHLTFVGPRVFSKLPTLEYLSLQDCPRLRAIDEDALIEQTNEGVIWPPLKTLKLSDNSLRYLPAGLVGRWDLLEKLDIINNEWSCDCDNQYLIGTILPTLGKTLMNDAVDTLKCSAPPEHAGKNLSSLANRKLRCLDRYSARPERDAAILVGVMIGLLLAIPVALTLFVFWRKGFFFCGTQGPATFSRAFYKRASSRDDEI